MLGIFRQNGHSPVIHDIPNFGFSLKKSPCVFGIGSQWPRGLRHEMSSLVRTLGSWVRIPLKGWMSVCVYSVFMLSCVSVAAFRRADHSSKESYRMCID
jgi:hypothetical protein